MTASRVSGSLRLFLLAAGLLGSACIRKSPVEPGGRSPEMDWIFVRGGTFQMGTAETGNDRRHAVILTDFLITRTEVTNAVFAEFLGAYGSDSVKIGPHRGVMLVYAHPWGVQKTGGNWAPAPGFENYPVLNTTWEGANAFCEFYGLRLPTEAEWEFAARGGNRSRGTVFSGSDTISRVGWYDKNSGNRTHPAGDLMQNELGLCDMTGNVWEWCSDWDAPYDSTLQTDPKGPAEGRYRIYRGGCWLSAAIHCTNDFRCTGEGDYHGISHNGFRCARDG